MQGVVSIVTMSADSPGSLVFAIGELEICPSRTTLHCDISNLTLLTQVPGSKIKSGRLCIACLGTHVLTSPRDEYYNIIVQKTMKHICPPCLCTIGRLTRCPTKNIIVDSHFHACHIICNCDDE